VAIYDVDDSPAEHAGSPQGPTDHWVVPRSGRRWAAKAAGPGQTSVICATADEAIEEAVRRCAARGGGRVFVLNRRGRLEQTLTVAVDTVAARPPG
jgi:hypothetical protein